MLPQLMPAWHITSYMDPSYFRVSLLLFAVFWMRSHPFLATFWWLITGIYRDSVSANTPVSSQGVFLGITRGVYRSLRVSSQVFSALRLGLGDILLPAFHSENLPVSPVFSLAVVRDAGLASIPQPGLRDVKLPWNRTELSCLQSSLEPRYSLCSWQKRREDLQRGQYEYKRLLNWELQAWYHLHIFLSLFSTKQLNTSFPFGGALTLVLTIYVNEKSVFFGWRQSKNNENEITAASVTVLERSGADRRNTCTVTANRLCCKYVIGTLLFLHHCLIQFSTPISEVIFL